MHFINLQGLKQLQDRRITLCRYLIEEQISVEPCVTYMDDLQSCIDAIDLQLGWNRLNPRGYEINGVTP